MSAGTQRGEPVSLTVVAALCLMNVILIVVVLRSALAGLPAQYAIVLLLFVLASNLAIAWVLWRHEPASRVASTE